MKKHMIFSLLFFLTGCTGTTPALSINSKILRATCYMNNFSGFPKKVTGSVSLELKNFLTIVVENKDKTERVEITFPKNKCKAN